VLNAVEAMPGGGWIAIRVAVGEDVVLEVEDSGPGIAEEIRDRVFEPFVTTKSEGHGIGLGLSVVHGIIASHGGVVEVGTATAGGALYKVVLPQVSGDREPLSSERDQPAPVGRSAHDTILLVEDEPAARDGLDKLLQMLGHGVAAVGDVAGAVDAWQRHGPFDLILTDFLLPDGTGLELVDRCRRDVPDVPVILMSGYVQDDVIQIARRSGSIVFLQKPFGLDRLREALKELSRAPG
jgi:CheY-like chemotaxis protein